MLHTVLFHVPCYPYPYLKVYGATACMHYPYLKVYGATACMHGAAPVAVLSRYIFLLCLLNQFSRGAVFYITANKVLINNS